MGPTACSINFEDLRDAIVELNSGRIDIFPASQKYNIMTRKLRTSTNDLDQINTIRMESKQKELLQDDDHNQVFRWASKYAGVPIPHCKRFTSWELRDTFINVLVKGQSYKYFTEENGIPKTTFYIHENNILNKLNINNVVHAKATINIKDKEMMWNLEQIIYELLEI